MEGYTITEADKDDVGTEIILVLKDDTDSENYSEYLDDYTIANLVKKYSDYIRFPITMYREKSRQKPKPEDAGDDYKPEYETYTELGDPEQHGPHLEAPEERGQGRGLQRVL